MINLNPVRCAFLFAGLGALQLANAQADPTRPHPSWLAAHPQPGAQAAAPQAGVPTAQILLISPVSQIAVVGGHPVRVGESHEGYRLVAIKEGEVVWRREDGPKTSSMHPAVRKTIKKDVPDPAPVKLKKKRTNGDSK
ncbi:MAG TPA: hypothetical protein VK996_12395 [Ramlibacter sp.]|nr:hypothetical protein [Ramlibacter sp.]